ncbi:MAG: alpha-glucosidase C-terminal domain-containing protein, partial [Gemmatimonadaceae bacterium]
LPETHDILKKLRAAMDAEFTGRIFLGEANQWPTDVRPYFGDGDECHMAFHFPVMPRMYMAVAREDRTPIVDIMERTPAIPSQCQWAIFLRNHDELTLEMVTEDERAFMYGRYASDPRMRVNVGIRRRLAPLMDNGRDEIELMHALLMSLPGSPVLYYGDEIGMGDNIYLGDRNGVRTPMQWSADRNAGFSEADTAALYTPAIVDMPYSYVAVNVEAQERTKTSLLRWIRRLIAVRRKFKAFGRGTLEFLHPANRKVLVFVREHGAELILCVNNLSRYVQPVELDLRRWAGRVPLELWSECPFPTIGELPYFLTLGPHGFYWFRILAAGETREACE